MPRSNPWIGTRIKNGKRQARVDIVGYPQFTNTFPLDTPAAEVQKWRASIVEKFGGTVPEANSFAANVKEYLGRISALPTLNQKTAHLKLWVEALGGARSRLTITLAEVEGVIQDWFNAGLVASTIKKRRTTLQSFFARFEGKHGFNPARGASKDQLKNEDPEIRAIPMAIVDQIVAAMPARLSAKPGTDRGPSLGRLRAAVMAATGIPPGQLEKVGKADLQLTGAHPTYRVARRKKGGGVARRTIPLTEQGRAAFQALVDADGLGPFAVEALNRSFKRAAVRVLGSKADVHLYDLRHSFGTWFYSVVKDLATVARFMGHAVGSKITARYAEAANAQIDFAVAQTVGTALTQAGIAAIGATIRPTDPAHAANVVHLNDFRKRA